MDRRASVRTLMILSAGTAILPSCLQEQKKSSLSLKNIAINNEEEQLLSELTDTIIPKTDTPGAKDVAAHVFALMMIDECVPPDGRDKFQKGLKEFEKFSKKKFDKSFVKCTAAERAEIVNSVENKKDIPESVAFFYDTVKRLTIQAFTTSKYYLTKVQVYQLVPGKFYGCVPVKTAS
jgi:hypothetical protein